MIKHYISYILLLFLTFFAVAQVQEKTIYLMATESSSHSLRSGHFRSNTNNFIDALKVTSFTPLASDFSLSKAKKTTDGELHSKVDRIFKLSYNGNFTEDEAVKILSRDSRFEHVEKSPTFQLLLQPNDPLSDSTLSHTDGQLYLRMHRFYDAWDVETGDTTVVIGVVDTGFDLDHEDLIDNLNKNYNDTIDSINNDNDFFFGSPLTDNFTGWDMADFDNDPSHSTGPGSDHGTMVLGAIAGTPNNGIGIAGTAYHCQYMPIKASPDSSPGNLGWGYDGIYYGMTHGVGVLNLSWGDTNQKSPILHELVKSATLDYDVLVVAAAGNIGLEVYYYPATMDYVLSVAALYQDSTKWWASTYNTEVDVCALGYLTLSTQVDDTYDLPQGTSNSAPIVAGAAGLLRSHFPNWNAVQIGEQIRVSGTIIDTMAANMEYKDRLGKMLDIATALTDTTIPSIRIRSTTYIDDDEIISSNGDSLSIHHTLINYLAPTSNAVLTLQAYSDNFTVIDSVFNLGALGTMDSAFHSESPYKIYIHPSSNSSEELVFRLKIQDGAYHDFQYFRLTVSPTVITASANESAPVVTNLNLFPNPTNHHLFVELSEPTSESVRIEIISSTGVTVKSFEQDARQQLINLSSSIQHLTSGLYTVHVTGALISSQSTFVKNE